MPPPDKHIVVASLDDGRIVWSRDETIHQVRYGLQVTEFDISQDLRAAEEFGYCTRHHAECEGRLDHTTGDQ